MVQEMNYTVAEDFIKENPGFNVYLPNPQRLGFEKQDITVEGSKDFEGKNTFYIIKSNISFVTVIDLKMNDTEVYKLV